MTLSSGGRPPGVLPPDLSPVSPPGRRWGRGVLTILITAGLFAAALFAIMRPADAVQPSARAMPTALWSEIPLPASTIAIPMPEPTPPAVVTSPLPGGSAAPSQSASPPTSPTATTTRGPYPPPGLNSAPTPLGTPARLAADDARYTFTDTQADGVAPIAYDPCRPIRYVMRPDNAPPEAGALIRSAFDRLTEVTGLQFIDEGPTDEAPSIQRSAYQPDRYGDRWAPVLVAWATESEVAELAGNVAGAAGSTSARTGDLPGIYVSGGLLLDGPQLSEVYASPETRPAVRAVVLHEMAHLVGLGHVEDPSQLMNPQSSASTTILDYQAGDLSGLVLLGAGPCVPQI